MVTSVLISEPTLIALNLSYQQEPDHHVSNAMKDAMNFSAVQDECQGFVQLLLSVQQMVSQYRNP
jgi:hypothetical protein